MAQKVAETPALMYMIENRFVNGRSSMLPLGFLLWVGSNKKFDGGE